MRPLAVCVLVPCESRAPSSRAADAGAWLCVKYMSRFTSVHTRNVLFVSESEGKPVSERLPTRPRHLFRHVAGVTPSLDRYDCTAWPLRAAQRTFALRLILSAS